MGKWGHNKFWENHNPMGYGPERYAVKSCGKRHGYCKVCRPDIIANHPRRKKGDWGPDYNPDKLAPGYVPHPTKTMWERHTEMHDIEPQNLSVPNEYGLQIDLGKRLRGGYKHGQDYVRNPPKDLKPLEQVLAEVNEGRTLTAAELRFHFGFTTRMIDIFRREEAASRKWLSRSEDDRREIERKEEQNRKRLEAIVTMATDGYSTLKDMAEVVGVTRERVRQIIVAFEKKEGITLPRNHSWHHHTPKENLMVAIHCRHCGKIVEVKESAKDKWRKGFCKEHAVSKTIWAYIQQGYDWYNADDKGQARIRYHANIEYKRKQGRESAKKWKDKLRNDPERWEKLRLQQRAATDRYYAKKKAEKLQTKPKDTNEIVERFRPFFKHGN